MSSVAEPVIRTTAQPVSTRDVKQHVAFVSGGMGGIGTAICRRLGQKGIKVVAGCLPGYEHKQQWLEDRKSTRLNSSH